MTYLIYRFISPSGKIYIGQTKNLKKRLNAYKNSKIKNRFHSAIKKYGLDNFIFEILINNLSKEQANMWERLWIFVENSNNREFGYNMTDGGDHNPSLVEEIKLKISKTKKENGSHVGSRNSMFGVHRFGKDNPNFGKKHPNINRLDFNNGWLGKKHKEETLEKMRKPKTEEHKKKISEATKGRIPWNKGKRGYKNGKKKAE